MRTAVCILMLMSGFWLHAAEPDRAPVAFYLKNLPQERVGGWSDRQIRSSLESDGFIVIEVDCSEFPKSSPELEEALVLFHKDCKDIYSRYEDSARIADMNNIFYVPEGYTVTRNIPVWNILEHGAEGSAQWVMNTWNDHIVSRYGMPEVSSPDQMTCPDGRPLDWNLYMDIVHPSGNASRTVPLLLVYGSASPRMTSFRPQATPGRLFRNIFPIGFLTSGYAFAIYDHCYNPLAKSDAWKHFKQYTLDDYNVLASSTAAMRYLRTHQKEYNLDGKIGVMGISKASASAMRVAEADNAGACEFLSMNPMAEEKPQPWSGADSRADVAYLAAGVGAERAFMYIDENSCPLITSAGLTDEYQQWDVYPDVVRHMRSEDLIHLDFWMDDLGHTFPCTGDDFATGESRYVLFKRFFDSCLKKSRHADVLYILPREGCSLVDEYGCSRTLLPDSMLPKAPSRYMDAFKNWEWASQYCGTVMRLSTGEEKYVVFKDYLLMGSDALESGNIFYADYQELPDRSPITVRFMEPFCLDEIRKKVTVSAEDGSSVSGVWTSSMKGTCFTFNPESPLKAEVSYNINVPATLRSMSGRCPSRHMKRDFRIQNIISK